MTRKTHAPEMSAAKKDPVRARRIAVLAPLVLADRNADAESRRRDGQPWYFININHPSMRLFYDRWMESRKTKIPPGDIERTQFELSLLSNAALIYMETNYRKQGRSERPERRSKMKEFTTAGPVPYTSEEQEWMQKNAEEFRSFWKYDVMERPGKDAMLNFLETSDFFTAPASTKFHGAYPGGLCEHSLNVARYVMLLSETVYCAEGKMGMDLNSAVFCALLHDVCKVGLYRETSRRQKEPDGRWQEIRAYEYDKTALPMGHGEKSVYIIQREGMRLTDEEAMAIRWHMGAYRDKNAGDMDTAFDTSSMALILHLADMLASHMSEKPKKENALCS